MLTKLITSFLSLFTNKKIILLESESDMCDSTKTIFDYLIKNGYNKKYKIYWCIDNYDLCKKYRAIKNVGLVRKKDLRLKEKLLFTIAGYAIYTHIYIGNRHNKRQIRVFVTHASMPFKNSKGWFNDPTYNTFILGTSEECVSYRKKVLGESDNYVITGLPRNDDLFEKKGDNISRLTNDRNYILWMPTFKHHKKSTRNDFFSETENDVSMLSPSNIQLINDELSRMGLLLIIKPHPSQDLDYLKTYNLSNVITVTNEELLSEDINPYTLLGNSSALITDFSSVFIDYLLVDKPIAFELTDEEKYKNGIGFVMDNPSSFMVGDKIRCLKDFIFFLEKIHSGIDDYKCERIELTKRMHLFGDNNSTERVLDLLNIK